MGRISKSIEKKERINIGIYGRSSDITECLNDNLKVKNERIYYEEVRFVNLSDVDLDNPVFTIYNINGQLLGKPLVSSFSKNRRKLENRVLNLTIQSDSKKQINIKYKCLKPGEYVVVEFFYLKKPFITEKIDATVQNPKVQDVPLERIFLEKRKEYRIKR